ncbi:MAG: TonB-dependent receptor, partial [Cyclobacteriaceae bacterium]|nr:TonB-dependent receptor [Cyclobacteriaceae bacterium]
SQNKIETGLISSRLAYDFNQTYTNNDVTTLAVDENGNAFLHQFFFSWKYRMNENLTIVSGVHNTLFSLNKEFVPEPRLSLRWNVSAGKSLYFGTGMYSRPHSLPNYFVKTENPDGTFSTPNTDLKMTRAVHLVGGYDWSVSQNLFLNITAYYQYLYHVPVENDPTSNRSLVNLTGYFDDRDFVSEGTGRNYGLELTLERYLDNHFYYLMTGSLYNSLYSALDGTEYNTRWNGNYVFNALGGKEFVFNKKEKREKTLGVNLKVSLQGGNRYNPINLAESQLQTAMIRYENPPFVERGDNIFLMNMGLSYKVNRPKSTREWKLEILNVTNHSAKIDEYYAPWTQDIVEAKQWSLLPNIIYRVQF